MGGEHGLKVGLGGGVEKQGVWGISQTASPCRVHGIHENSSRVSHMEGFWVWGLRV